MCDSKPPVLVFVEKIRKIELNEMLNASHLKMLALTFFWNYGKIFATSLDS